MERNRPTYSLQALFATVALGLCGLAIYRAMPNPFTLAGIGPMVNTIGDDCLPLLAAMNPASLATMCAVVFVWRGVRSPLWASVKWGLCWAFPWMFLYELDIAATSAHRPILSTSSTNLAMAGGAADLVGGGGVLIAIAFLSAAIVLESRRSATAGTCGRCQPPGDKRESMRWRII